MFFLGEGRVVLSREEFLAHHFYEILRLLGTSDVRAAMVLGQCPEFTHFDTVYWRWLLEHDHGAQHG